MRLFLLVLSIAALVVACSRHETATTMDAPAPARATTGALAGTPMAAYGRDLDKARNVQNLIDTQAARQARAIEAATGSSG